MNYIGILTFGRYMKDLFFFSKSLFLDFIEGVFFFKIALVDRDQFLGHRFTKPEIDRK